MFPFKTDTFTFFTELTPIQVENILRNNIQPIKLFKVKLDNSFYGSVKNNKARFELGQYPSRNSFRPTVNLMWSATDRGTEINGHLSMDKRILIILTFLPILGTYFSIINAIITPFVVVTLLYLFLLFVLFQTLHNLSKTTTKSRLDELISGLKS